MNEQLEAMKAATLKAEEKLKKEKEKIRKKFFDSIKDTLGKMADEIMERTDAWFDSVTFEPTELEKLFETYSYSGEIRQLAETLSGETIRTKAQKVKFVDGTAVVPIKSHDEGHNYALDKAAICVGVYNPGTYNDIFIPKETGWAYGNHMTRNSDYFRKPTRDEVLEVLTGLAEHNPEWIEKINTILEEE